jgi:hypothetical protein
MEPPDFLYIDNRRLNSAIEWISSPVTSDKTSGMNVSLSLTGLKVGLEQAQVIRQMTQTEKIKFLPEHLRKHDYLAEGRVTTSAIHEQKSFRLETCKAVKLLIPPASPESMVADKGDYEFPEDSWSKPFDANPDAMMRRAMQFRKMEQRSKALETAKTTLAGFKGLTIFFSDQSGVEPERQPNHHLFLLADVQWQEQLAEPPQLLSANSALIALYDEAMGEIGRTVFNSIPRQKIDDPTSSFNHEFLRDPVQTLERMGARRVWERTITSLYRLRRVLPEKNGRYTTIGYPIFISARPEF